MKLSGFSIVRNAVELDFPIVAALRSILPLCDEVVVNVGRSTDGTLELVRSIGDPKLRILETEWDLARGSVVLREETDRAMDACSHPWGIYIQADEVLHEAGAARLRETIERAAADRRAHGVVLRYRHLFGRADLEAKSRRWYRREIRAVRLGANPRIRSFRDAQGFRIEPGDRRVPCLLADAEMFHYGYLRSARALRGRHEVDRSLYADYRDYPRDRALLGWFPGIRAFTGVHPAVAAEWVAAHADDPERRIGPPVWTLEHVRYWAANQLESLTGLRPFEFRNYRLVG